MIQAVALDFDGVILESADIKTEAFRELFRHWGPEALERILACHARNAGISRFKKFETIYREILRRPLDDSETQRLGAEFSRRVFERVLQAPFVRGAEGFLREFSARLPLYVVSGTPAEELVRIVNARGLTSFFRNVFGSPATKPDLLAQIRREVGISNGSLLCVGDGWSDLESARLCGARFVGRVAAGKPNPFSDAGDVFCVADLAELMERWEEAAGEDFRPRLS